MSLAVSAGRRQPAAHPVDALVVRQRAAEHDPGMDARAVHGLHVEADQPVVQQQHRAAARRPAAAPCSRGRRAWRRRCSHSASRMNAWPASSRTLPPRELADADLRPLQVGHDRDLAAELLRALADATRALDVVGARPVREIEADDVHAGGEHPLQHGGIAARRARASRRSWYCGAR